MVELRIKEFWGEEYTLDQQVNDWLSKTDDIEIIDIRYSISKGDSGCLILYKKNPGVIV